MNNNSLNKASVLLAFSVLSGGLGVIMGSFITDSVNDKYTSKDQLLNSERTEIIDIKTFVNNGVTVTNTRRIPARIVPDSLLQNLRP